MYNIKYYKQNSGVLWKCCVHLVQVTGKDKDHRIYPPVKPDSDNGVVMLSEPGQSFSVVTVAFALVQVLLFTFEKNKSSVSSH